MIKKILAALTISLALNGCTAHKYVIDINGDKKECTFLQGKKISGEPNFWNNQFHLSLSYTNSPRKTSLSGAFSSNYDFSSLKNFLKQSGITFQKENAAISASLSDVALNFNGISISLLEKRVGTPLLYIENGLSLIPPRLLPFYLLSKLPNFLLVADNYLENKGTDHADRLVRQTFKNILFRDLIPFYQMKDAFFDFKRIFGINSSVTGENLEEVLQDIRETESSSKILNLIESNVDKYPKLKGELKVMYDSLLLNESFFFFKRDIENLQSVYDKIEDNLHQSEKNLEDMVKNDTFSDENHWSYLADLYHLSNLLDNHIFSANLKKESCDLKVGGTYLFLANEEKTEDFFFNLPQIIEYYKQKGYQKFKTKTLQSLEETLLSLDSKNYNDFKNNFESLFYSYHYLSGIHQNFSPQKLKLIAYYLGSQGKEQLAQQFFSLESLPEIIDLTRPLKYLQGLYDLIKKKEFPVHDHCDLPDLMIEERFLDLRKIVNTYYDLDDYLNVIKRKKSASDRKLLNGYQMIREAYNHLLREHSEKYPKEFNYFWHQARKDYLRKESQFWNLVIDLNYECGMGYSKYKLEKFKKNPGKINYQAIEKFYNGLEKAKRSEQKALRELGALLGAMKADLIYVNQVKAFGFEARPLKPCPPLPF